MNSLTPVNAFIVPKSIVHRGIRFLQKRGQFGLEGMVLWAAKQDEAVFHVKESITPKQIGLHSSDGVCVVVRGEALHHLNVYLFEHGWTLGAHIHSHPGDAYHSSTDDAYCLVTQEGGLSLVVPDFGAGPFTVERCAAYRLTARGWNRLTSEQACKLIVLEE